MKKLLWALPFAAMVLCAGCTGKGSGAHARPECLESATVMNASGDDQEVSVKYRDDKINGEGLMITYKTFNFFAFKEDIPMYESAINKYKEWTVKAKESGMTDTKKEIILGKDRAFGYMFLDGQSAGMFETRFWFNVDSDGETSLYVGSCVGVDLSADARRNMNTYIFYIVNEDSIDDYAQLFSVDNYNKLKARAEAKQSRADTLQ